MADIQLLVNGQQFTGWEDVSIQQSIETAAGAFSMNVSDKVPWPISPGDECVVSEGGDIIITGYVDKVGIGLNASTHSFSVQGRDKTADIIDCSAMNKPGEWRNVKLSKIAKEIAKEFGIEVISTVADETVDLFKLQPGEKGFEAIERACRLQGFLLTTDGLGNLVITSPSTERALVNLVQGENILEGNADFDLSQRYSRYIAIGQHSGTDAYNGTAATEVKAEAKDPKVSRNRPLVVVAENMVTNAQAKKRAEWEATVRAARASKSTVTVQGWRQSGDTGDLWKKNTLVACDIPLLGISGDMLISAVTFSKNLSSGTTTVLELSRPDAFKPEPVVPKEQPGDTLFDED